MPKEYAQTRLVDHLKLIEDLLRAGITQQQIGDAIGMQQSAISRLWRGDRKPEALRYPCMVKLIELHRRMKRRVRR